jgi:hypothetical protein
VIDPSAEDRPDRTLRTSRAARPLTGREIDILSHILRLVSGDAGAILRTQLDELRIIPGDGRAQLFSQFDNPSVWPARIADGPLPVSAEVCEESEFVGEIIVFVRKGRLSSFEFAWVTRDPPVDLPGPDSIAYHA